MSPMTLDELKQDGLAMSVARAVALANDAAIERGIDPQQSRVTITKELNPKRWHIHYGSPDYISRRGGDLEVIVDDQTATVTKVVQGQ